LPPPLKNGGLYEKVDVCVNFYSIVYCDIMFCQHETESKWHCFRGKNPDSSKETVVMETEKYTIEKVEFDVANFEPWHVFGLDDENVAVIMNNDKSPTLRKVYVYNLSNKQHTLIFEGEFENDISLKRLVNGNFLLEGGNMALEIEKQSFKLKQIIPYPEGAYEADFSHSQTQMVYNKEEGLYLHTLNSSSSKDTEVYKYDEDKGIVPSSPAWSFDDKNIGYILFNRFDLSLNEVGILDPISKKQKSYIVGESAPNGWWFQDNMRFVTYCSGIGIPIIKVIDTGNGQIQEYEKTGSIVIMCPPYGDQVLYVHIDLESESKYSPERIVNLNVATNTSDIVTPDFLNITSCDFSPSGNKVFFIANSNPEEKLSLYVAQKKTK